MRLGMPVPRADDPERELAWAVERGLGAVYVDTRWCADETAARAHGERIRAAGLVPAEVGAWSNPLSRDPARRAEALEHCRRMLAIAEAVGARCCVNIAGSVGERWDGPCADDLRPETVDLIVESVRAIVDAVRPRRSFYTLETMPWMLPDSADSYLELLRAIDRPSVAVHFDPANLVNCPRRSFASGGMISEFVTLLGPRIRSVHVKDIAFEPRLTVHLQECRPGLGSLDHATLLRECTRLDPDLPLMLEHLPSTEEYLAGAEHLRGVAERAGLAFARADRAAVA
jgi:sugar phosphate isomerase/epimerase